MIGLLVGVLFFIIGGGATGASLIDAFGAMNTWYIVVFGFIAMFSLIPILIGAVGGAGAVSPYSSATSKMGGLLIGAGMGSIVTMFMLFTISIQLYLTNFLYTTISPELLKFSELSDKQITVIIVLIIIPFIQKIKSSRNKDD